MTPDAGFDIVETDRLLCTTRAVRRRLDFSRPVERQVLLDCLRIAIQAPTASNSQDWRWVIVTDEAKRAAIADIYRSAGASYLDRARREQNEPQTTRVYESAYALSQTIGQAPALIIPCLQREFDGTNPVVAASAYGSILPAAWSLLLALRSRGLGSTWTTLHLWDAPSVAALLDIPHGVQQMAMFPVAYTIGTEFKPAARPPVEEITSWNSWGSTH